MNTNKVMNIDSDFMVLFDTLAHSLISTTFFPFQIERDACIAFWTYSESTFSSVLKCFLGTLPTCWRSCNTLKVGGSHRSQISDGKKKMIKKCQTYFNVC